MTVCASIVVRKGLAHIPVQGRIESGGYLDMEPVHTVHITAAEVVRALQAAITLSHPKVRIRSTKEWRARKDPVLEAAGVGSWKQLALGGATYTIEWHGDAVTVYMSRLDDKGRFVEDPAKTRTFPEDTALRTLVEAILDDVQSRPELLGYEAGRE